VARAAAADHLAAIVIVIVAAAVVGSEASAVSVLSVLSAGPPTKRINRNVPGAEDDGVNGSGLPRANLNNQRSNHAPAPQSPRKQPPRKQPPRKWKRLGLVAAVGRTAMHRVVVDDHVMKVADRSILTTTMTMIALLPNCWTRPQLLKLMMLLRVMTKSVHAVAAVADADAGVPSGRQGMRFGRISMLTLSMIAPKRKFLRLTMIMKTMRRPKRFVVVADVRDVVAGREVNPPPHRRGRKVMTNPIVRAVGIATSRHGSIPSVFSSMRTS